VNNYNGLPADRIEFSSYPRFQSLLQHCVLTEHCGIIVIDLFVFEGQL